MRLTFASDFKRARRGILEQIAHYRTFVGLTGIDEQIAELEELRDKWDALSARFEARGRAPSEPFDWDADQTAHSAAREKMDKLIKVAAAAAAAAAELEGREQAAVQSELPAPLTVEEERSLEP